jgi:phenylalanine ammonia-lyase
MQLTQAGVLSKMGEDSIPEHAMPAAWVRATMVVRCNATVRGHSAVSLPILQAVLKLLRCGLTPVVPLRGSVSASGDLMPLSYIAGTIEGNPDIQVQLRNGRVMFADKALQMVGVEPVTLGPKEGLGLVNGTASSAALGALVMHEAQNLALLTQALTGVAVEVRDCSLQTMRDELALTLHAQALNGSSESFHRFIAEVRPHPGQIECARNIFAFVRDSKLARHVRAPKDRRHGDLIQDRYSLRSAPQWIGPQLEDLLLAHQQITVELNSSCDNPLVDVANREILYGCNFQAASVTSAMEKTRLSLQMFGRILFAQLTEMVDPNLSGGLPANLAADDPSLSFTMKGVEISMAAYMAELSYLANPMSSHVQAAEMHNQSINSMAFASARMTMQGIDILTLMCACSLYVGCQALDLRVLHSTFVKKAGIAIEPVTARFFGTSLAAEELERLHRVLESHFASSWKTTTKLDLRERCELLANSALPILLASAANSTSIAASVSWAKEATEEIFAVWTETSQLFNDRQHTFDLLGSGSKALYGIVRGQLAVPFHTGLNEHPAAKSSSLGGRPKKTIGGWISIIYDAIKDGQMYGPLMSMAQRDLLEGGSRHVPE